MEPVFAKTPITGSTVAIPYLLLHLAPHNSNLCLTAGFTPLLNVFSTLRSSFVLALQQQFSGKPAKANAGLLNFQKALQDIMVFPIRPAPLQFGQ